MSNEQIPELENAENEKMRFTYGSVIRINAQSDAYENDLFFINYVNHEKIVLFSKVKKEFVELNLAKTGEINDKDITSIQVLLYNTDGYASQNGLTQGKTIKLIMKDGNVYHGKITQHVEDMIVIQIEQKDEENIIFYIDFHYGGIDDEYEIEKIVLYDAQSKKIPSSSKGYFIPLKQENVDKIKKAQNTQKTIDEDEEIIEGKKTEQPQNYNNKAPETNYGDEVLVYNMEQQVDDFTEYYLQKNMHKRDLNFQINKYVELMEKYTDLNEDKIKIRLPYNQLNNFFLQANNVILPVTSYYHQHMYIDFESPNDVDLNLRKFENIDQLKETDTPSKDLPSLTLKEVNSIYEELQAYKNIDALSFFNNFDVLKQKIDDSHMIFDYNSQCGLHHPYQKVITINKDLSLDKSINYFGYGVKNFKLPKYGQKKNLHKIASSQINIYDGSRINQIKYNGFMIPNSRLIKQYYYLSHSNDLVTKSTTMMLYKINYKDPKMKLFDAEKSKDKKCKIFQKSHIYAPFSTKQELQLYHQNLDLNIKSVYNCLYNYEELSMYEILQKMNLFFMFDLNKNDYNIFSKILKKNVQTYSVEVNKVTNALKKQKAQTNSNYEFNVFENMYNMIIDYYKIQEHEKYHTHEIFDVALQDGFDYLNLVYQNKNSGLYIDFDDAEFSAEIDDIVSRLNDKSALNNMEVNKEPVIYYENLQEMYNDHNKIILKPIVGSTNIYEYLYGSMVSNYKYNESMEQFASKVRTILESMDINPESHKEIFDNADIRFNLLQEIINNKVMNGDYCYVKSEKQYYVYNENAFMWIEEDKHESKLKKRKILYISNREENFDIIKENLAKSYLVSMINTLEQEQIKKFDLRVLDYQTALNKTKERLHKIASMRKQRRFLHNNKKEKMMNALKASGHLDTIIDSPYMALFHKILSIESLDEKYDILLKFITRFTVDIGEPNWLMCIKTNVKLVPKYMIKLAKAQLVFHNYENAVNELCKSEGGLSEDGSIWIHKESGYTLKNIEFSVDYGMNELGHRVTYTTAFAVEESDIDELLEADDLDIIIDKKIIEEKIILLQEEKRVLDLLLKMSQIIGINFVITQPKESVARDIYSIYTIAKKLSKQIPILKKLSSIEKVVYAIFTVLSIYVQCFDVYVKKTFPGCNYEFKGAPVYANSYDNIEYLACILEKISKNNPNMPYKPFSKKSKKEIFEEMKTYLIEITMKNSKMQLFVSDKKNALRKTMSQQINIEDSDYLKLQFRPILENIELGDAVNLRPVKDRTTNSNIELRKDRLQYNNVRLQEFVQNSVDEFAPILTTKYNEPFLVNYCCNDKNMLIYDYITNSDAKKRKYREIINSIMDDEIDYKLYRQTIGKVELLNVLSPSFEDKPSKKSESHLYSEELFYTFLIDKFNFENPKPIPSYFEPYGIQKPEKGLYDKYEPIKSKIQKLKSVGIEINGDLFIELLQVHHRHIYKTTSLSKQEEKSSDYFRLFKDSLSELENEDDMSSYLEENINIQMSIMKRFASNYMDRTEKKVFKAVLGLIQKEKNNQKLLSINYFIINILPNNLISNKKRKSIICKHWKLAPSHIQKLEASSSKIYKDFEEISIQDPVYLDILSKFQDLQAFVQYDTFKHNKILQNLYMKYIFCMSFNLYTIRLKDIGIYASDAEIQNDLLEIYLPIIRGIMKYTYYVFKTKIENYEDIKSKMYKTKQSEKKIVTDRLKAMNMDARKTEKVLMNLNLGTYSFALNKNRLLKYSSDNFDYDYDAAMKVQSMMEQQSNEVQDLIDENEEYAEDHNDFED